MIKQLHENGELTPMKTTLSKFVVALIAACSMTLTAPVAAHAEPTGHYSYICIGTDGSSYTLREGAKLSTCKGSYLKKYINGNQVASIHLAGNGTLARPLSKRDIHCLIAFTGTLIAVVNIEGTWVSWVGAAASIDGLTACKA